MKELVKKILPPFLLSFYHFILAFLGAIIYRFPSRSLKVIGVTGTNGKTTVTEMIAKILEEGGYKVALANSIRFKIGEKVNLNMLKMTMPGRLRIQKFLREAVNSGCQYAVLEVTSEGIKQHRHRFIHFEAAVFTNLSPEHIEAHGGFENYQKAKGKLFQVCKNIHIINLDDKNADYFLKFPAKKKYLYKFKIQNSKVKSQKPSPVSQGEVGFAEQSSSHALRFTRADEAKPQRPSKVKIINQKLEVLEEVEIPAINLKLLGEFNISNALAAICVGLSQGINLDICKKAVEEIEGIPGRMEEVISQPFKVIVDYAFTPNALEKVYQTIKNSGLICVLGACGGGRDKWKRPVLGEIAAKYCDKVIVTNEDPYDENPMEIIEQVAAGAEGKAEKILDRREAIRKSLQVAKPGDTVIITGKGCEPWICLEGGKKIPWDDRQIVREEFKNLTGHQFQITSIIKKL